MLIILKQQIQQLQQLQQISFHLKLEKIMNFSYLPPVWHLLPYALQLD